MKKTKKPDGRVNNGGSRPGSGRKATEAKTRTMRVTAAEEAEIKKMRFSLPADKP
jgi:hypothetical protein